MSLVVANRGLNKSKGWSGEPIRHSLARKGITTGRKSKKQQYNESQQSTSIEDDELNELKTKAEIAEKKRMTEKLQGGSRTEKTLKGIIALDEFSKSPSYSKPKSKYVYGVDDYGRRTRVKVRE